MTKIPTKNQTKTPVPGRGVTRRVSSPTLGMINYIAGNTPRLAFVCMLTNAKIDYGAVLNSTAGAPHRSLKRHIFSDVTAAAGGAASLDGRARQRRHIGRTNNSRNNNNNSL